MDLVAPAGSTGALKAALAAGADAIYIGLRDQTNARNFPGLNFAPQQLPEVVNEARRFHAQIYVAINTYARAGAWDHWKAAVDQAAEANVSALIAADIAVLDYASRTYPDLRLHLSVQASATNWRALRLYRELFNIRRAVLPRVLSLTQIARLAEHDVVPLEVFGFGSLCIMVEGRCLLSSYACGRSPNNYGACSPAESVEWIPTPQGLETRVAGILIDRFTAAESAGYPTLCKGRFRVANQIRHVFEEPTSLNTLDLLPNLAAIGIQAIKLEGRQRSPAYVTQVVRTWRAALDAYQSDPQRFAPEGAWKRALSELSEGQQTTLGAYARVWR
ncbi:protease [mine drainage metagenome]|uniref:Protease n=3 Tax=mine drainage metagenome TaxID=410659 RepID=T0YF50_9ZZZZ